MDWLTALIRLIEALALPAAAIVIVLLFRGEFRELVPLVRKLKAGPLEAEFERNVREVSQQTGAAITPENEKRPDPTKTGLFDLAKQSPRSAILEAWARVEVAAMRAAVQNATGSPSPDVSSPLKAIRELLRTELVNPEDVALFHDLRGLRNQAAHIEAFEPSVDAAWNMLSLQGCLSCASSGSLSRAPGR